MNRESFVFALARHLAWVIPLIVVVLFAGCTGNSPPPDPDDDPNDLPDLEPVELIVPERSATAWEQVAESVEEDGSVSKEVALQAFVLAFGDIPGVVVPDADSTGVSCGSAALYWVEQHADSLSDEERAAVEAALASAAPNAKLTSAVARVLADEHSCGAGAEYVDEDGVGAEEYRQILEQELAKVEAALGESLGIPVYLTLGLGKSSKETLAWAIGQSRNCLTLPASSCHVELLVNRPQLTEDAELRSVFAHELVHCFQAKWLPPLEAAKRQSWLGEGFADFLGEHLHPAASRAPFEVYAQTPDRGLASRSYDAQGFYFHLHTLGIEVAKRYKAAFLMETPLEAFAHLIEPARNEFSNTWASSFALDLVRGDAWTMSELPPGVPPSYPSGVVGQRQEYAANPPLAGTRIAHLELEADIVRLEVTGNMNGRVSWDGGEDVLLADLVGQSYCGRPDGCTCPPGTRGSPPQTPLPAGGVIVSVASTTTTSSVKVKGYRLSDFCRAEDDPNPPADDALDSCVVGTWVSNVWTLLGPIPALNSTGGDGAQVTIAATGRAQWNFGSMQPLTSFDDQIDVTREQYTRGSASAQIATSNGVWEVSEVDTSSMDGYMIDNILGEIPLVGGPGLFVLMADGTYTCAGGLLTYTTIDPVQEQSFTITFHRQ